MTDRNQLQQIIGLLEYLAINHPIDAKAEEYRRHLTARLRTPEQMKKIPSRRRLELAG
jgi:hypothetical protein